MKNHITAHGQSVSLSWCQDPFGTNNLLLICCQTIIGVVIMSHPFWWEDGPVTSCPVIVRHQYPEDKAIYNIYNV